MILFVIIGVILGAVSVVFALQNAVAITVTFLFWQINASLALVLIVAILSGMIISLLVSIPELIGNYLKFRNISNERDALQKQVASYKAMISEFSTKSAEKTIDTIDADGKSMSFLN